MITWIDWAELERQSGWSPQRADAAFDESFDSDEQVRRASTLAFSERFDKAQADLMPIDEDDTVLDACCGVGRHTIHLAPRCKRIVGLDGSDKRLAAVRREARARGLDNVETMRADWFAVEPGVDFPAFDVVVGCNCPALADIAKFSRAATKRCIYLHGFSGPIPSMVDQALFEGVESDRRTLRRWDVDDYRLCAKNSFDVTFNRLLSLGASPTVSYCDAGWHVRAVTREGLCEKLRRGYDIAPGSKGRFAENVAAHTFEDGGEFVFERTHRMVMMVWDPADVRQD